MKLYGSLSKLVSILFRKDSQDITVRPNQATTYSASRDIQLPPGDTAHILMSATSVATLTNKTFDADGSGNSITNIENADIKAGAAIDAAKIHDGSVSNTEFGYLDGVTSSIQTQFGTKVTGPASATDEAITRYDGTSGKLVQDSSVTISDAGVLSGASQLNVDNLRLDGNALSSTNSNGDLQLDPNGSGAVSIRDNADLRLSDADNSAYIGHKSAAAVTSSITYQWPEAPASSGYVLASTTGGVMTWVSNASTNSFKADWTDSTHTAAAASFFDDTADTVLSTAHGLKDGQALYFSTDGSFSGTGLTADSDVLYYVVNATTDDFQVAATYGGAFIDITGVGLGNHTYNVTSYAAVHGLGTQDLVVQVYDKDDGFQVEFDNVIRVSTTHVIINGTELPGGTGFRVLVAAV